MKLLTRLVLMTICMNVFASTNAQTIVIDTSNNTMDVQGSFNGIEIHLPEVKIPPAYPGGVKAWNDFLRSNINLAVPFGNKAQPGVYKVMIRFIVGRDGKLHNIGAESNCGYGLESEVIRCIKKSAAWKPATVASGYEVASTVRMIVMFTVKLHDIIVSFPK